MDYSTVKVQLVIAICVIILAIDDEPFDSYFSPVVSRHLNEFSFL